jgi:predicted nucleic acid-binding protein
VFLDTAYAIALSVPSDDFHERALRLADRLQASGTRVITTQAILLEIGNAFSRRRHRAAAVRVLDALEADPNGGIVVLSAQLYEQAFQLYRGRPAKEWGLTDCISFIVMRERGITDALTGDEHFQRAGFRALLREDAP